MDAFRFNEAEWLRYDVTYIGNNVPAEPGVYALSCPKGHVIYVGKSESSVRSRLASYGSPECHNKWIKLYFSGQKVALAAGQKPADLYFTYWLTNSPAFWEAVAIQQHRLASRGLNQRNEWVPLMHSDDANYLLIAQKIRKQLNGDELRRFQRYFGVTQ